METLLQDVRGGVRLLFKHRWLTAIAVLMLAIGVGMNAAIFSVASAVLLRPLSIAEPDRLLVLWERDAEQPVLEVSLANFHDWRARNQSFANMAAFSSTNWSYDLHAGPAGQGSSSHGAAQTRTRTRTQTPVGVTLPYAAVSASFFDTLGAKPALGRTFVASDDEPSAARTVVLSHGLWQRQFGSDPAIVGKSITLKGPGGVFAFEVIGVMPAAFDFPRKAQLWTPVGHELAAVGRATAGGGAKPDIDRGYGVLYAIGRLKPAVAAARVKPELDAIVRNLTITFGGSNPPREVVAVPVLTHLFGQVRSALLVLLGAVGLVLLIACANVAGMLMVLGRTREEELAVRYVLGASRLRIVRQLLTEGVLLAICGGTAGVLASQWGVRTLLAVNPVDVPGFADVRLDARVLVFALMISIVTAILVGLIPAWRAARVSIAASLKGTRTIGGAGSGSGSHVRSGAFGVYGVSGVSSVLRGDLGANLLVIGQVALAALVVIAAALTLRSFANVTSLDLGFTQERVLTFGVDLPDGDFPTVERKHQVFDQLIARLHVQPGVEAAGAIYQRPLAHGPIGMDTRFLLDGQPLDRRSFDLNPVANWEAVTPGYFGAMQIALKFGRLFDDTDRDDSSRVVIVSESFARRVWPGQQPLGKRLLALGAGRDASGNVRWQTVIGVVADVRYRELERSRLDLYLPHRQSPIGVRDIVIRTTADPRTLIDVVKQELATLHPRLQPADVTTMDAVMSKAVAPWRFTMLVFGAFATIALALTAVGLFGVIAATVSERTREIGLRAALGAQPRDLLGMIMRRAFALTICGITLGSLAAYALSRLIANLLFGVAPTDVTLYAVAAIVVLTVSSLASYLPARRAMSIDPTVALRQ
jgi:putative ABC transport system permease protein